MNTKELRIGNLIYGKIKDPKWGELRNHIAEVSDIHRDRFTCQFVEQGGWADSDYGNDFEPILLTPEILEACGFIQRDGAYTPYWWRGRNPVTEDFLIVIKWSVTAKCFFIDNVHHKVHYLHQLQNWYYLKSGEELEVIFPEIIKT